jgi:regulator of nucleoside diphosphate kinase
MHAVVQGERLLTDLDFLRLSRLVEQLGSPYLADVLAAADVTSSRAVHPGVVTMYSRVELLDIRKHKRQVMTLCYPRDAEPALGMISVMSPVGGSLLGLKVGDTATWRTPYGEEGAATVVAIQHQPEATGDYCT